MIEATTAPAQESIELQLERHRGALMAFCYRMLGSTHAAEDAVQETMLRAWRSHEGFEGRSSTLTWLHSIATNVCLDALNSSGRRAMPMDLGPAGTADSPLGKRLADTVWLEPIPDAQLGLDDGDPARTAEMRETIRLAFVAALQNLAPKQRAVLILRDVLGWRAAEVAELLGTTVAGINSALQRARATVASADMDAPARQHPRDIGREWLLDLYVDAFENYDIDRLTALLHLDATWTMPPYELWLNSHEDIRRWCLGPGAACRGSRLVPVRANGSPAFAQYKPAADGGFDAWSLQVLEVSAGKIAGICFFLDVEWLFPLFGLPPRLLPELETHLTPSDEF